VDLGLALFVCSVCCSVLQFVVLVLLGGSRAGFVRLQCVAVCVAVCCSVLQCVAVCCFDAIRWISDSLCSFAVSHLTTVCAHSLCRMSTRCHTSQLYPHSCVYVHVCSDISFKKTFCLMNIRPQDFLSHEPTLWFRRH